MQTEQAQMERVAAEMEIMQTTFTAVKVTQLLSSCQSISDPE